MIFPTPQFEFEQIAAGFDLVAGCDEVGRGPLAGPVVAASVILNPDDLRVPASNKPWWSRVRDSKTVGKKELPLLSDLIKQNALSYHVAVVSHETIDQINILNAALEAMKQSVEGLNVKPRYLFVDGTHILKQLNGIDQSGVVDGDAKILSIAAASIIAKVVRDEIMLEFHQQYPMYGFDSNKGYGTKFHCEAIVKHGLSPIHRKSFVRRFLDVKH